MFGRTTSPSPCPRSCAWATVVVRDSSRMPSGSGPAATAHHHDDPTSTGGDVAVADNRCSRRAPGADATDLVNCIDRVQRRSPLLDGSWIRRPGSSFRCKFSAHRDTVVNRSNAYGSTLWRSSPDHRRDRLVRLAIQALRGDYGRLLMEHFWVEDHFRDALGDHGVRGGQRLAVLCRCHHRPGRHPARPGPSRRERVLRPIPVALRNEPATGTRGLADPARTARLPGQHGLDEPRGDVPPGPAHGRSDPRRRRDRPLRRLDRARRHVLGGDGRSRSQLGEPALDHDR
jgi:hypothetical protein